MRRVFRHLKRTGLASVLVGFGFVAGVSVAQTASSQESQVVAHHSQVDKKSGFDHSIYDQILQANIVSVRDGKGTLVDYQQLKQGRLALDKYLAAVALVDEFYFKGWSADEQLAMLINTYNAQTLALVLDKYPALESIKDLGSIFRSVWSKDVIYFLGQNRSLDNIEHVLIRGKNNFPKYGDDPRIHFAVNCASISCPGLAENAYNGSELQDQLEKMTLRFLSDRDNNRFENGVLRVSKIFDWYESDFTSGWRGSKSLADFFVLYSEALGLSDIQTRALQKGQVPIQFNDYNWDLNDGRSKR